jgi:hypothetical protein
VTVDNFAAAFQLSDRKFADSATTSDYVVSSAFDNTNLDALRHHGGKLILYHGLSDPLIVPFGSLSYTSGVFERYRVSETQEFMRSFFYPGAGHCSGGTQNSPRINQGDLFKALTDWVEHGTAPDYLVAYNDLDKSKATVSRKICKYPDEARYKGSGDNRDQTNFYCTVSKQEPSDLSADSVTARRYHESP